MTCFSKILPVIACTLCLFFITTTSAFSCTESETYETLIKRADIIFEGHLLKYEKHQLFKEDGRSYTSLVMVFSVDKNWKGTKEAQEIRVAGWNPSVEKGGALPPLPSEPMEAILILSNKAAEKPNVIYWSGICPEGMVPAKSSDAVKIQRLLQVGAPS